MFSHEVDGEVEHLVDGFGGVEAVDALAHDGGAVLHRDCFGEILGHVGAGLGDIVLLII